MSFPRKIIGAKYGIKHLIHLDFEQKSIGVKILSPYEILTRGVVTGGCSHFSTQALFVMQISSYLYTCTQLGMCAALLIITAFIGV